MNFIKESLDTLVATAKAKRLTIKEACQIAGIHPTTVSRWRHGQSPRMLEFNKLWVAVNAYEGGHNEDTRKNGVPTPPAGKRGKHRAVRS